MTQSKKEPTKKCWENGQLWPLAKPPVQGFQKASFTRPKWGSQYTSKLFSMHSDTMSSTVTDLTLGYFCNS